METFLERLDWKIIQEKYNQHTKIKNDKKKQKCTLYNYVVG